MPQQPIVAAVVTADRKVLIGKRNDGKPPWTFIAGAQRLTESMATTASREVKEEAGGLLVKVGDKIGERVHPNTGRTMIYMAAAPTHGTDIAVGDRDELAEVAWVDLGTALERMPDMYEPVRAYLEQELGGAGEGLWLAGHAVAAAASTGTAPAAGTSAPSASAGDR